MYEKQEYKIMRKVILIGLIFFFVFFSSLFAQWEPDVRLTFDPAFSYTWSNNAWNVAAHGDTVHVVWYDERDGNNEIYYKRSPDEGITWETDVRLTNDPTYSWCPCVAVSGSYVHVVWDECRDGNLEIYYKRSTDGGTTWETDTRLTDDPANSEKPCAVVSGDTIHVVWMDDRDGDTEIYYKRSPDGGKTWETDVRLTDDPAWSESPSVAVADSNVHVVWFDDRDGGYKIYYKRSTDEGTTWETDVRLTDDPAWSESPSVAVADSNVHVVWQDKRDGDTEIYYKRSPDGGTTWETDVRLTDDIGLSEDPSVVVSGANIHVVWQDKRDGAPEIYYKCSPNGGTTWETDTRLTNDTAYSEQPSVAVADSNVHVVWHDYRDGNLEIYYKRNPTGNVGVVTDFPVISAGIKGYLTVYPNPFRDKIVIEFGSSGVQEFNSQLSNSLTPQLKIYDVGGRLVKVVPLTTNHLSLGTDLMPGIYFVKVEGCKSMKVVKIK